MKMRIYFIVLSLVMILSAIGMGEDEVKKGELTIILSGFENNDGVAIIALSNSQENYEKEAEPYRGNQSEIVEKTATWIVNGLPFGEYAIKVFHDEDEDKEMDTNFLGIPSEDYGFSNNARGTFGPASWEEAKFLFNSHKDTVYIKVE
jgi:uncharacterized protein (DUF2141 family)